VNGLSIYKKTAQFISHGLLYKVFFCPFKTDGPPRRAAPGAARRAAGPYPPRRAAPERRLTSGPGCCVRVRMGGPGPGSGLSEICALFICIVCTFLQENLEKCTSNSLMSPFGTFRAFVCTLSRFVFTPYAFPVYFRAQSYFAMYTSCARSVLLIGLRLVLKSALGAHQHVLHLVHFRTPPIPQMTAHRLESFFILPLKGVLPAPHQSASVASASIASRDPPPPPPPHDHAQAAAQPHTDVDRDSDSQPLGKRMPAHRHSPAGVATQPR
jgi:hypothetical protein